jgi:hypothetical protein
VTLALARGANIEGVVRDRYGRRVAGAHVAVGSATTVADRDGNFRLADVPVGAVVVEAELESGHGSASVELQPGDDRREITVELVQN